MLAVGLECAVEALQLTTTRIRPECSVPEFGPAEMRSATVIDMIEQQGER